MTVGQQVFVMMAGVELGFQSGTIRQSGMCASGEGTAKLNKDTTGRNCKAI